MNLPARYPEYDEIIKAIDIGLENFSKIGLLGALIADHPQFEDICSYLQEKLKEKKFEISVSSLRADGITELVASTLVKGGQNQTTIAVEAGSQRLRNTINKRLCEEDIFKSVRIAREQGLSGLKIYGIIGLPTETNQDIDELIDLVAKLKKENKGFKLTLSISSFVPKANTPFQWETRENNKTLQDKTEYLRKKLSDKKVLFKPTSVKWDYIQAILSRGDRRLAPLLEKVYKYNGSLGSWGRSYKEIIDENQFNIPEFDWYALRERDYGEILPWDFINLGADKENLWNEKEKSHL